MISACGELIVLHFLQNNGLRVPGKSSCIICPYHTKNYWIEAKNERPQDFAFAVEFDKNLRDGTINLRENKKGELFIHSSGIPLDEVDLRTPLDHGQSDFFDVCDSGYCGI